VKRAARPAPSSAARQRGFVLDSHALLDYFEGEAGGAVVRELIREAEQRRARLYLSLINWGEVFYIVRREKGAVAADEIVARLDILPITLRNVDRRLVQAAASLNPSYSQTRWAKTIPRLARPC
jgi:ribonuclease VapC